MKDCQKYGDDCSKCNAKELCDALTTLLDLISEKPIVPSDDKVEEQTMDFIHHMGFVALDKAAAREVYNHLDFDTFHGLVIASTHTISDLYLSWEDKCKQIENLKVQLDAQEALHGETV